jgi:hypothetical protein
MTRLRTAALAALAIGATALPASAEFFGWQVVNVPDWDVLNVRAYPSPISTILVGYPNGTTLSLTGKCTAGLNLNEINGQPPEDQAQAVRFRWCEVWVDPAGNGNFRTAWVYGKFIAPL